MSESKGSPGPWHWGTAGWGWLEDANGDPVLERDPYDEGYPKCSDANRALIAAAPTMAAILAEIQWSGNGSHNASCCPVCYSARDQQHAPDCRLDALLRSLDA